MYQVDRLLFCLDYYNEIQSGTSLVSLELFLHTAALKYNFRMHWNLSLRNVLSHTLPCESHQYRSAQPDKRLIRTWPAYHSMNLSHIEFECPDCKCDQLRNQHMKVDRPMESYHFHI